MPKKPRARTTIHSQHFKRSGTLFKSSRQYFCHIFWSVWKKISSESSVLVVTQILRLFVNILAPDEKYCLSKSECLIATNSNAIISKSKNLLKSAQQYFSHIFLSFRKKSSSKNSVLVVSKILRLFVNILTPEDKSSLSVKGSL